MTTPERSPEASEEAFQAQVEATLRRNYLAHLGHGLLGQTGMRLVNAPTFLPAYIYALSGSDLAVGIARGLQYFGMFLSSFMGATLIEHRRRVLPVGFLIGALMRLQVLGLALTGLWLPAPWPLISAWVFLALFGAFLGVQGVVFSFLTAKVIPVRQRGLLVGLRNALAGISATAVAIYAGSALVDTNALGNGYAATFLVAFVCTSFGLAMLLFLREPETPGVRARVPASERLRALPALLRSDRDFTRYFSARALAVMGRMGMPFYAIYADARMGLSGVEYGWLTGAFVLSQSAGNLVWGIIADRRGFRFVFLATLLVWIASVLLLMQAQNFPWLVWVFLGIGTGFGGFQMASQNLVLEFGSRDDLPMRIGVANSASNLVAALGVVVGGALAGAFSYPVVFWSGIAFQAGAFALVALTVREPRGR